MSASACLLAHGEEADNASKQRDAFDERGGDQHRGADVAGSFGLTGDAFQRGTGQTADAEAGADGGQASADAGGKRTEGADVFECHDKLLEGCFTFLVFLMHSLPDE